MQTRGRTELGLDPNGVRHHVPAAILRAPPYVAPAPAAAAAAAAAVENRSYDSVWWDRWLRCIQIFITHRSIWSYRCTTKEVQPRSDTAPPAGAVARAES